MLRIQLLLEQVKLTESVVTRMPGVLRPPVRASIELNARAPARVHLGRRVSIVIGDVYDALLVGREQVGILFLHNRAKYLPSSVSHAPDQVVVPFVVAVFLLDCRLISVKAASLVSLLLLLPLLHGVG